MQEIIVPFVAGFLGGILGVVILWIYFMVEVDKDG